MMSSELEHQSVLQLSKCRVKLKVEFWKVQLIMCYYFIIFNKRVLLIFLLKTHVDLERLNNGQPCQQWKGWVLSMAGGAHPDWSLRGKTVTPLTCMSTSKSLSGCVNLGRTESSMCIDYVPSSPLQAQPGRRLSDRSASKGELGSVTHDLFYSSSSLIIHWWSHHHYFSDRALE